MPYSAIKDIPRKIFEAIKPARTVFLWTEDSSDGHQDGQPVECFLTPGSCGDVDALKYYAYDSDGAIITLIKHIMTMRLRPTQRVDHIQLLPIRKKNSKRALSPSIAFVQSYHRKRVETAGSLIAQLLPKSIMR